jgi:hypothetical protein
VCISYDISKIKICEKKKHLQERKEGRTPSKTSDARGKQKIPEEATKS